MYKYFKSPTKLRKKLPILTKNFVLAAAGQCRNTILIVLQ